jgi:hypothetical protein
VGSRPLGRPGSPSRSDLDKHKRRVHNSIVRLSNDLDEAVEEEAVFRSTLGCFDENAIDGLLSAESDDVKKIIASRFDVISEIEGTMRDGSTELLEVSSRSAYADDVGTSGGVLLRESRV